MRSGNGKTWGSDKTGGNDSVRRAAYGPLSPVLGGEG